MILAADAVKVLRPSTMCLWAELKKKKKDRAVQRFFSRLHCHGNHNPLPLETVTGGGGGCAKGELGQSLGQLWFASPGANMSATGR